MRRARGFTLLEVLVAVAVLGIALVAVLASAGQSLRGAAGLRERTLAHWVALNELAEIRLSGQWPDTGESDGDSELAGRQWRWELTVNTTQDEDLRRLDIRVALADAPDETITVTTGFMGRPMPRVVFPGGRSGDGNQDPPPGGLPAGPPPDKNPSS